MALIKLKPETVDVIDTLFAIAEQSDHEGMPEAEFLVYTEKIQKAKMDWLGYKTFLDI